MLHSTSYVLSPASSYRAEKAARSWYDDGCFAGARQTSGCRIYALFAIFFSIGRFLPPRRALPPSCPSSSVISPSPGVLPKIIDLPKCLPDNVSRAGVSLASTLLVAAASRPAPTRRATVAFSGRRRIEPTRFCPSWPRLKPAVGQCHGGSTAELFGPRAQGPTYGLVIFSTPCRGRRVLDRVDSPISGPPARVVQMGRLQDAFQP